MTVYTNAYKGRKNRKESAAHLREEFDRIAEAFTTLSLLDTAYIDIYSQTITTEIVLINPVHGQMQEITINQDTLVQIQDPTVGADSTSYRLTLIVNGSGHKVINGWGPQTWKENGNGDWSYLYTGMGPQAGMVLEFAYDGKAWVCLAFSRNDAFGFGNIGPGDLELFPLTYNLTSQSGNNTITWSRSSYGWGLDADATFVILPPNQAQHTGARYLKNWIATASDLQSIAFVEDGATVTTEAGAGQDAGDVDKITFDVTGGELQHWMLLHFGRSSEVSSPIKFAITFDAKMAGVITEGTCRAVISIMGVETGVDIKWDRETFNLTGSWQSFGAILDPVTGKDTKGYDLNTPAGGRTLTKFAIESPSDGVGNPILVENLNVVVLKDGDEERVELPQQTTIGSSVTLAKTASSTGTWVDGTKVMTLDNGEWVNFADSLTPGKAYLVVATRTSGNTASVILEMGRTYWEGYSKIPSDTSFVKDAPFTYFHEGNQLTFRQDIGSSSYIVNIYEISGELGIYDTLNVNSITNGVVSWEVGAKIPSNIAVGVIYDTTTITQLLGLNEHRKFDEWTQVDGPLSVFQGEIGVDARPSRSSVIEDKSTGAVAYIKNLRTIPDDTQIYSFGIFLRKVFDSAGVQIVDAEWDGLVTSPSKFVDVSLKLTGGTTEVGGERVRMNLPTVNLSAGANTYHYISIVSFEKWVQIGLACLNNGTGNDTAELRIYPASSNTESEHSLKATSRGWCIADWAQLEDSTVRNGIVGGATIPGLTKMPDSAATTLADGVLYTPAPVEVGDVTTAVWTFDIIDIYKNISWVRS